MSDEPTYEKPQFEPEKILAFSACTAYRGEGIAIENDDSVDLVWTIVIGAVEECKTYLRDKRPFSSDFDCSFRRFVGPWRVSAIKTQDVPGQGANRVMFIVTYSKGYYKAIDWTKARLDSKKQSDEGADLYLLVRFPYCDPASVPAMLTSLNTGLVYTNPVIGGITHTGTFYNIFAATKQETDGSITITLFLAADTYKITAYSEANTGNEQDVYYYWRVPKATAQGLVTAWKSNTGASAKASYNEADTLVDLTLSRRSATADTLTTEAFSTHCDTTVTLYYKFGTTAALATTFVNAYKAIGAGAGLSASARINQRGDGLYDAEVVLETVTYDSTDAGTVNGGKHHFKITEFTGDRKITNYKEWGWNVTKTALDAKKATFDIRAAGQNKRSSWQSAQRKDNCLFDFMAEIETHAPLSGTGTVTAASSNSGIARIVKKLRKTSATTELDETCSLGQRLMVIAEQNELGSFDIESTKETYASAYGVVTGWSRKWYWGSNQSAAPDTGAEPIITSSIGAKDGGEIDYLIVTEHYANLGDGGLSAEYEFGQDLEPIVEKVVEKCTVDTLEAEATAAPAVGEKIEIEGRVDPETNRASYRKRTTTFEEKTANDSIAAYKEKTLVTKKQDTAAAVADKTTPTAGHLYKATNVQKPNGRFDTEDIDIQAVAGYSDEVEYFNDGVVKKTLQVYFNQPTKPASGTMSGSTPAGAITVSAGTSVLNLELNQFGLYDYIVKRITVLVLDGITIHNHADVQYYVNPIRSFLAGAAWDTSANEWKFSGSGWALHQWILRQYQTSTATVKRTYSVDYPSSVTAASASITDSGAGTIVQAKIGYDAERECWFVDVITILLGALSNFTVPIVHETYDSSLG